MSQDLLPAPTQPVSGTVTIANPTTNPETGLAKDATLTTTNTEVGGLTETAPSNDTNSSGLNGRLQRIAQRLTSLIALLPTALGAGGGIKVDGSGTALPVTDSKTPSLGSATSANSLPVVIASDQGVVPVGGNVASAGTDSGNPVKVGGRYNTTPPTFTDGQRGDIQIDSRGDVRMSIWDSSALNAAVVASASDGLANTTNTVFTRGLGEVFNGTTWDRQRTASADALAITGIAAAGNVLWNGASWDRQRTPLIFKSLNAVSIATETTIWTPAAGKKFRLMGFLLAQGTLAGNILLKDNTAGTTILIVPSDTVGASQASPPMGNGILSAAANNVLTATGSATQTLSGFVFGTEE